MTDNTEKKAEAIFEATMDLPTQDRPAAIAAACGGDAVLEARVGALHAGARAAEGFLSEPTMDAAPVTEKPGTMIGRYKLLEKIGEGGFGTVFTAEQQEPVRRLVALKVIKLGMDTREVVARFEAERQALAMMDHPNIAKVLDAGATETGRPYFVMELVRGSPVTDYADKHKLSTRDRVAVAAQICRAVQHAHSKGVIHRDLKPTNVLVTVSDDKPVPKVIDFGIAKATLSPLTDHTLFTAHRQLVGTPQYMSPEQADSDGSDIDTRSDIYSLGVLLYELLVGTTPMDARALRSAAYDAMRKMICDTDVPRPATRLNTLGAESRSAIAASRSTDVRKLSESVTGELDWIVMKALEKDRSRRYETAAALADDLNRYLGGEAVLAGPVSGTYRLKKAMKRYKAAVAIGCAIAACLLLGVAGTTWGLVREAKEKQKADARLVEAEKARADANTQQAAALVARDNTQAVVTFLSQDVLGAALRPAQAATNSRQLMATIIKPAEMAIGARFKDRPEIEAAVRQAMGDSLLAIGDAPEALPQLKRALEIRRSVLVPDAPDTLSTQASYADALAGVGRLSDARDLAESAWYKLTRGVGPDERVTLGAEATYARILCADNKPGAAVPLLKHAWEGYVRDLGMPDPRSLSLECDYATALIDSNQPAVADPLAAEAYWESRRTLGFGHPFTFRALNLWSDAADAAGLATATRVTCEYLEQYGGLGYSPDHAERMASVWERHARAMNHLGKYKEAAVLFRRVATTATEKPDPDRIARANAMALECDRLASHPPATAPTLAAEELWPDGARQSLVMMESGADGAKHNKDWAAAAELYRKVLTYRRKSAHPDLRAIADDLCELSVALEQLGNLSDAADQMRDASELLSKLSGLSDPRVAGCAQQAAEFMDRAGRKSEAAAIRHQFGVALP